MITGLRYLSLIHIKCALNNQSDTDWQSSQISLSYKSSNQNYIFLFHSQCISDWKPLKSTPFTECCLSQWRHLIVISWRHLALLIGAEQGIKFTVNTKLLVYDLKYYIGINNCVLSTPKNSIVLSIKPVTILILQSTQSFLLYRKPHSDRLCLSVIINLKLMCINLKFKRYSTMQLLW